MEEKFAKGRVFDPLDPEDIRRALDLILSEVDNSKKLVERMAQNHSLKFRRQIVNLLGEGPEVLIEEEKYLGFEVATFQLQHLKLLEKLVGQVEEIVLKTKSTSSLELKKIDRSSPIFEQVEEVLEKETERLEGRMEQKLEERRQQAIGINGYIWRTRDDDKVRLEHLENDDKVFRWNSPSPITGHPGDDFGCRCVAEPIAEGRGEPKISKEDEVEVAFLKFLIGQASKIIKNRKVFNKKPISKDKSTGHGIERGLQRKITNEDVQEALSTAKRTGNVTTKIGKYGTEQIHYRGSNGVTVVVETSGRNAGKIITIWRH